MLNNCYFESKLENETISGIYLNNLINFESIIFESNNLNEETGTIPIIADCDIRIIAEFKINNTDIELIIKSLDLIFFKVKKSLIGEIDEVRVINNFYNLIGLIISNINKYLDVYIKNIKEFIINIEGIDFSDIFAKSFENYIKVDLSPVLSVMLHSNLF